MAVVFFLDIYYCIIIAWTFFYLIATFTALPDLPWNTCGKQEHVKKYRRGVQDRSRSCQTCLGTPAVSRACQRVSKSIEEGYRTGHGPARPALEHLR
jgi:hypothetical protein